MWVLMWCLDYWKISQWLAQINTQDWQYMCPFKSSFAFWQTDLSVSLCFQFSKMEFSGKFYVVTVEIEIEIVVCVWSKCFSTTVDHMRLFDVGQSNVCVFNAWCGPTQDSNNWPWSFSEFSPTWLVSKVPDNLYILSFVDLCHDSSLRCVLCVFVHNCP